jgi:hypothetical protein
MKLLTIVWLLFSLAFSSSEGPKGEEPVSVSIIGPGEVPSLAIDQAGNPHLVYGKGDSIMYSESINQGKSFSKPTLVGRLPNLFSSAMRGPQIAFSEQGLTIVAANKQGNIFSYRKEESGKWIKAARVNDLDTVAKEGLMAFQGDGKILIATWLDLRQNKRNKIVAAKSTDGGRSWSKNRLLYASPDSTVCECCKPAVAVRGNQVCVLFRNWLHGNRDLYLLQSQDGGDNFGPAQKLGNGSWPLNGCPMDGGGVALSADGSPQTVWRRQNKIFACEPGKPEMEIGAGRSCSIERVNGKNVYAWTENGEVIGVLAQNKKLILGKGILPVIRAIGNDHVLCVWENDRQIQTAVLEL